MADLRETSRVFTDREILGFKKLELIGHARTQMKIRDISLSDIYRTLEKPDEKGLSTQPGRERVRWNKTIRYAIDVVYETLPDRIRVITVIKKTRRIAEGRK